jgi:tetratricopeptide (TPR) repeat protein
MRKLNFLFITGLIVVLTVLGVGVHFLHAYQIRRNAWALLVRAERAEANNELQKAEQSLSQYVNLERDDGRAWKRYAQIVERGDPDHLRRERVFLVYEEALRHNPDDLALERQCADLALALGRFNDARRHLDALSTHAPKDLQDKRASAEITDLLGQCARGLNQYEQAKDKFEKAIEDDPGRVSCYYRLARLQRIDLRQIDAADNTIEMMMAKNPKSSLAYLTRWRYFEEFSPPARESDLKDALKLAPNDPEVLLIAAAASESKQDAASARAYLEKGLNLDPKNLALASNLAGLESRDGHLDRAEAILRKADQANPSLDLAFVLADTLIAQDKIDGNEQAGKYMTRLRNAGLGDTLVRFLESKILVRQEKWAEAIPQIENARAVLKADPQLAARLNVMLAECYSHVGTVDQRMDALRQAGESPGAPEPARIEYAQALARSGKIDQAIAILSPMIDRRPELRLDLVRLRIRQTIGQPSDRRNWPEVNRQFRAAKEALPQPVHVQELTLLNADLLTNQGNLDDARSVLSAAQTNDPKNLSYRLALARLMQRQGQGPAALKILDQAEKDQGPSPEIQLARLDYWGREGGAAAKAAVAKLAQDRGRIPAADKRAFLSRLATVEAQLRELDLARQHGRELANLQPDDIPVRLALFDLALEAGDEDDASKLVQDVRKIEDDKGTFWRYAQATLFIDKARRSASRDLANARALAAEIAEHQPDWWVVPALKAEIAELEGSSDQAIEFYIRAVELGNVQPAFARRLVALLSQRNQPREIERVTQVFRDRGVPLNDITIVKALAAIRNQDFEGGIALAQEIFSETSKSYFDHLSLGRIYMAAGSTDLAGKELRRAVQLGPGVTACWVDFVGYLVQTKQPDKARAVVEAARKTLPADRQTLTLAECYRLLGDLRQAEVLIGKALEDPESSGDPATLRLAATIALSQNPPKKVDEYLNKLDQIAGTSPSEKAWANRLRVSALLRTGQRADQNRALELVAQNLRNDPESVEDKQLKASVLAMRPGGREEAVKILEQLSASNVLGSGERFLLAQLYLSRPDEQKYQSEMQKLLKQDVKDPRYLAHFISYWTGRNQLDQADRWLDALKKAEPQGLAALEAEARLLDLRKQKPELMSLIQSHEQFPDQIGPVADLFLRYGFLKEAETTYKALIARNPDQPEGPLALAVFLARQDRASDAMEILKKAWLSCPPERVATASLELMSAPSVTDEQKRQVEAWCVEAIRRRPDLDRLTAKLGVIRLAQGRFDEAEAAFRRILNSNPDDVEALNDLAWLLSLRDETKFVAAQQLIDHAIDLQGPASTLIDTRAVVCIRSGKLAQAVVELTEARARDMGNASLARHLAWAYQSEGKADQASEAFQQAEKLGWKPEKCDPLERPFMEKLRSGLRK